MQEKKYRHEYKYVSPEYILQYLESRVASVLQKDSHVGKNGAYNIRSIYFDDAANTCYFENENGTDPREKFRIRIYNGSKEHISLELKQKERGKCHKMAAPLPYEVCMAIMRGEIPLARNDDSFLFKKLVAQMQGRALRPVVIVEYERVPFIWQQGNVRVTFDRNIRSSDAIMRFFDEAIPSRPVMSAGTNMLEVKFDEFLPDFIYELLQTERLQQTAFSKYEVCRRFSMAGTMIR